MGSSNYEYFKHTTRTQLSDREKQKIIDAVGRASSYLNERFDSMPDGHTLRSGMRRLARRMVYLSRAVALVKGSTQPRYLYRHSRVQAVEFEARKIAKETGADYQEVRKLFLRLMDTYIDTNS